MELENTIKKLYSLLKYKKTKAEIENLNVKSLNNFIDNIIKANNSEIDLEIFNYSNGKIENISEYYEVYKKQELKPLSGKHYQLLLENTILIKLKN
jgi:hypothetical protein